MQQSEVVIIGGGSAGLSAAIASARLGTQVTVLEAGSRVGRKILASGNGRCNLTNVTVSPEAYSQPDFVAPVLAEYSFETVREFFGSMGLLVSANAEGRVYPVTNAAGSVLDVLRMECARLGVDTRCGFEVSHISQESAPVGFVVHSNDGEQLRAQALVVTTGGGDSFLSDVGHGSVASVPVLGPIRTNAEPIRGLSGVRIKCAASLLVGVDEPGVTGGAIATERGELLFREYGVSGIMVFDLSRYLEEGCVIAIDFFPDVPLPQLESMLARRCAELPWRTAESFFVGMLNDRVARAVLRAAAVDSHTPAGVLPTIRLAAALKEFRLEVTGRGEASQSQVTRGGAPVDEFDARTMSSRLVGGLFAAGEVLDVDGRSGGYNLHWAWASGIVAGESAARFALDSGSAASKLEVSRD